ncbi:MAG: glycosyltransferase family 4 protein [Acidobacteriaceae bacterium]
MIPFDDPAKTPQATLPKTQSGPEQVTHSAPRVFMMDLWATVPYYTAYLSRALREEGVNLTVGSITYYLDPDCFRSRRVPLDPGPLNIVGGLRLPKLPRRVLKLAEATLNLCALTLRFLTSPPEIIHVQFLPLLRSRAPMDLWFVRFFQHRGTKIILTVHDLLPHDTGERYKNTFLDLYAKVDSIICHSGHVAARLESEFGVPASKINVIPHGPFFYDISPTGPTEMFQSLPAAPNRTLFLFQGIILPYKGVDLLLNAWQQVEHAASDPWLVIAGTGSPELLNQIRNQIHQLGLQRVHLYPRFITTEELVALYRAADVVVYPYRAVTTSGALATGLALGKAIVASGLKVFRELLTDQETALLVDPEDQEQLAEALLRLANQPDLREALSRRVREMDYGDRTWQSIAAQTCKVYQRCLSRAETASRIKT